MKLFNLKDFTHGWFIGDFLPTIQSSNEVEVAIKKYNKGDCSNSHYHKLSNEITVIIKGTVKMNDIIYNENDIILIEKNEITNFESITDSITCVVKMPCVKGDKYEVNFT